VWVNRLWFTQNLTRHVHARTRRKNTNVIGQLPTIQSLRNIFTPGTTWLSCVTDPTISNAVATLISHAQHGRSQSTTTGDRQNTSVNLHRTVVNSARAGVGFSRQRASLADDSSQFRAECRSFALQSRNRQITGMSSAWVVVRKDSIRRISSTNYAAALRSSTWSTFHVVNHRSGLQTDEGRMCSRVVALGPSAAFKQGSRPSICAAAVIMFFTCQRPGQSTCW